MAHRIDGRKLGRKQGPRLALYKNLTVSVLRYERIQTTEAKAKEIRGRVEKMIAPKYADRTSGFTRIVHLGQRYGDAAPIVQIELV